MSGVMLSLEKNLGMLCPWNGPVAGSAKQPTGVKPRMLKTEEVVLVVVKTEVVDEEVVGGGVEDEHEEVLLVVETVEDDEEDVEDTVENVLDVLSDVEKVELEDDTLEVDELVSVELAENELNEDELADEEISEEVEELISLVDDEDGTLVQLELDVEVVLLRAELLELDTAAGARLLYIDSLDRPPHYHHQLIFQFISFALKG